MFSVDDENAIRILHFACHGGKYRGRDAFILNWLGMQSSNSTPWDWYVKLLK